MMYRFDPYEFHFVVSQVLVKFSETARITSPGKYEIIENKKLYVLAVFKENLIPHYSTRKSVFGGSTEFGKIKMEKYLKSFVTTL